MPDTGLHDRLVTFVRDFKLFAYRIELRALKRIFLPRQNQTNALRGAFGECFRRIVCLDSSTCRGRCAHPSSCPYAAVFQPSPPAGSQKLSRYADIPRPFVFRAPLDGRDEYGVEDPISFDLLLYGNAGRYLAHFIFSLRALTHVGLGPERIRCLLERVSVGTGGADEGRVIYQREDSQLLNGDASVRVPDLTPASGAEKIRIEFLTPTILKSNGKLVREPEFHHLVKRVRDRVNALAYFFQDGVELPVDFREIGRLAEENARRTRCETRWVEHARFSRRRRISQDQSGFVGVVEYEGNLAPFLPLLLLGQWTHAGKSAVWGNGWYTIQVLS